LIRRLPKAQHKEKVGTKHEEVQEVQEVQRI